MRNRKKISSLFMIALCMLLIVACNSGTTADSGQTEEPSETEEPAETEEQSWAEVIGLNESETVEELYEKAKEEGEVVVYAQSSATENVVTSFEQEYPGVRAAVTKVSNVDMLEKIRLEHEGGVQGADVVFGKDANGIWKNELLDKGILHSYQPEDLYNDLKEPYNSYPGLPIITEIITIVYNTDANSEPPIDNWWDLTRPEWKGKITMKDPLGASDIQDLFLTMIQHSDEMAEAYKEEFGEDIELNGTENAGYEFVKRLLDNDVVLMSSMGDSVDAVAESTDDNPPVVIASTVKLRDTVTKDAPLAMIDDLKPKVSVPGTSSAFIVDEATNVNAAKLFIRWLAGGEDGQGEGFEPFNNPGTFSTRASINQDFDVPTLDELDLWKEDVDFYFQNSQQLQDFLIANQ